MNTSVEPPAKLSRMLEMALEDLEAVEAKPDRYRVDMSTWHDGACRDLCHVCLAGAVIANRLKAPPYQNISPSWFSDMWRRWLYAIDNVRVGEWPEAFRWAKVTPTDNQVYSQLAINPPSYSSDAVGFKAYIRLSINVLRKYSL